MTQRVLPSEEVRELLGDIAAQRFSVLFQQPRLALQGRRRRRELLSEAEAQLVDVHRHELATLLFLEAQCCFGRVHGPGEGFFPARSVGVLEREIDARRARVERSAQELEAGRAPQLTPGVVRGDSARAVRLLQASLDLIPDALVRAFLGLVEAQQGAPEAALRTASLAREAATPRGVSRAYEATAYALWRLGRPVEATEAYETAARADPTNRASTLLSLFFWLQDGDSQAIARAGERVDALGAPDEESRGVLMAQRMAVLDGRWQPDDQVRRRVDSLRTDEPRRRELLAAVSP